MGVLSLNSNINALAARRRLDEGSAALQRSFERLSSGLRINHASDDAAGLAIAMGLAVSSRIFSQGVRNVNDGISLLNVAEGALGDLGSIVERLKELATSASNSTMSLTQRRSLDKEAYELQKEFNRITDSARFNGRTLLDASFGKLHIQAGIGSNGLLASDLGSSLSAAVGTGGFGASIFSTVGNNTLAGPMVSEDFNGDGYDDIFAAYTTDTGATVYLSNGDGTFKLGSVLGGVNGNEAVGDVNGDGIVDILTNNSVYLGNGDGTFRAGSGFTQHARMELADVNGDGRLDYLGTDGAGVEVRFGNGNGTFAAASSVANSNGDDFRVGDLNGDGVVDLAVGRSGTVRSYLGGGNGSFSFAGSIAVGATDSLRVADFNHDGFSDVYVTSGEVLLSNGNGTFSKSATVSDFFDGEALDINGDGIVDLLVQDGTTTEALLGNGDGTFMSASSFAISSFGGYSAFGDFNGDGAVDSAYGSQLGSGLWANVSNTRSATTIGRLDLLSASSARSALTTLEAIGLRISKELSSIGSTQSRLQAAGNVLEQSAMNYTSASSRIRDVDVAQESAALLSRQIQQQAAAAILGQANQAPALALTLLRG